jgi:hypothetical protein
MIKHQLLDFAPLRYRGSRIPDYGMFVGAHPDFLAILSGLSECGTIGENIRK